LDYENQTKVFENHFLNLNVNKKQKSKLYGIIGPSGIGKTTFLSISWEGRTKNLKQRK